MSVALLPAIRRAGLPCHVMPDGATVVVDDRTAYEPDALIYCGERADPPGIAIPEPNADWRQETRGDGSARRMGIDDAQHVLVEVISPSTGHIDRGDKLENYFKIPSVQHYLMVDPDQRMVVHHQQS